ncbi:MAG: tetratricopeptide repeat protein [Bacteroidetes bacterium]|nr:tetratricopeptide repeat protein [Bacteroidota bacterium]
MHKIPLKYSFLLFAVCISFTLSAQFTKWNNDPDEIFKLAKDLYQKTDYSLAYPLFKSLYASQDFKSNIPVSIWEESKYYAIISGLQLNDETAKEEAIDFIALEHNTPRIEMMSYFLAEYFYRKNKFTDALTYYEKAGLSNLDNGQIAQMKFHEGYVYFTKQQFNEAKPLLDAVRQIPGDANYVDANYYYGFILFSEKRYTEALGCFKICESQSPYQNVVPYYIAEIYYFNNDRDQALNYAENILKKSGNQYYDLQLKQLVGHIYFEKKEFKNALPFLETYVSSTKKVSRADLYELSFCYYQAGQYSKAATGFKELGGQQDSLAQNSMYLLAKSYLELDMKPSARSAFLFCSLNSSNLLQKEISKFNYGKLSYELGYSDVALNELKDYVTAYPRGEDINEAKELLVRVMANTNNFKDALNLLQSIGLQSEMVKKVYPKILLGRAEELINDQQILQANDLLNQAMNAAYNEKELPFIDFWKGEIAYRTNDFDSVNFYLSRYLKSPVSYEDVSPVNAYYTLGYSNMRQENYPYALLNLLLVVNNINAVSSPLQQDAYARIADCYFMQKNYTKAVQMYDLMISHQFPAADYALYQKAMISGGAGNYAQKIGFLQDLAQRYPKSNLLTDANLEIANTYLANENYSASIAPLNALLNNQSASALKPQVYLKLGIAYFNQGNTDESLNNFQKLIKNYPNADESDEAVNYVRNIFLQKHQPGDFITFMQKNGKEVSFSEADSLTFISAQNAYENKMTENALAGLNDYLTKFPNGQYAVEAAFEIALIYSDKKDFTHAIQYFDLVNAKSPNKYAEEAALQSARIAYFELKDYTTAEQYFSMLKKIATTPENKLESMRGLLRSQYKLGKWADAVSNAQELLTQKEIATDDKMMANMAIAKSAQLNNQVFEALDAYKTVINLGKSEYAAEARYEVAVILFSQQKYADAEKAAFEVINKSGSYNYWITKSYILLGDIYFAEKDYFNAEATLKSVVENASIPELQSEAQKKLDRVVAEKNQNSKIDQSGQNN